MVTFHANRLPPPMTAPRPHPPLSALAPTEVRDRLDPLAPDLALNPDGLGTLPYGQLKGPGFERLCYELLLAQGLMPRFFGRSGQADYGVDIIVEQAQTLSVFQCKNLAAPPSWQAISQAVQTFESDWLHHAGLPRPTRFVYCCPHPLDEQKLGATWTEFRQAFIQRTGIELHFWDRHSLDAQLRSLPVIVAGVFSASYAEHFCPHSHDWRHAPWIRVQRNQARHAVVQRFLQQHDADKLYIADHEAELFAEILSQHGVLVIRGLPGSGKTSLTLALASRQRHLYYASLRDANDVEKLWQSALQRLKLPSVFFLDDCHVNLTLAGALLERLAPEWRKGQLHLVLGLRDHPTGPNAELDDTPDWLRELQDNQQVLNLKPDRQRTRAVAEYLRPDLIGLSAARLDALHHGSSGDLLLLDELLSNIRAPSELDTLQLAGVLPKLHQRYFGARTRLPTVQRLAALAQFDLTPQADYFTGHWQDQEKPRLAGLITELFSPPRYQFLHASLAELVLHALIQLEAPEATRTNQVRQHTVDSVLRYLDYLRTQQSGADALATLNLVLRTRLKLCSPAEDTRLKAQLLAAPTVIALVREQLAIVPFGMLWVGLVVLKHASHTAQSDYVELLCARLHLLFNPASDEAKRPDILHIGLGLYALRLCAPTRWETLAQQLPPAAFMQLILDQGGIMELFQVLQDAPVEFRAALLAQLDAAQAERLLNKTISAGRSIGTLNLAMRELNKTDPALLAGLEQAIGAPGWMRLIDANGTLLELFHILRHATPEFRAALLAQLDAQGAEALISQTVCAGRAIESLHWSVRVVMRDPVLCQQLERCLGAKAWWRLVLGVGTLYSLQQLSQSMSEALRQEMAAVAAHLTTADWRALLARGLFLDACTFISQALPGYPPAAQAAFVAALADAAEALAQQASWFDLNLSQAALSAAAHSPAAAELQRALATRIAALHVAELEGLDFKEACNGLAFAWRQRPDLRQALAAQLWRILPPPAQWPQAGKDLTAIGWVLNLACDPSVAQDEALRLRQASLDSLADAKLTQFATLPLFLLLWHLAALTFERCTPGVFACAMPPALIDRLIAIVQVRALRRSLKEEHLSEMALAGVLLLLFPAQAPRLRQALAPLRSMSQHLQNLALAETFVPAFFALKGIALIDRGCVLTSMVRMGLLFKAKAHEPQGPALAFLRQSLS